MNLDEPGVPDDHVDDVFGYNDPWLGVRSAPPRTVEPVEELPTAAEMVEQQTTDAVYRLHFDRSRYLPFPWGSVEQIAGVMANPAPAVARGGWND